MSQSGGEARRSRRRADAGHFPVVAIGASAGGLDACRKLLDTLPARNGMAFILVQHLDPTHESLIVKLLANHTSMTVRQAVEGMPVEPDHVYVIPPGAYLAVDGGSLRLSEPLERHGARLPFDFLLHALAAEYGERAVCVILSGTGADGSLGLVSVKNRDGLVIAQDPDEAAFDGMPRSAIGTRAVDQVLPVAQIHEALAGYRQSIAGNGRSDDAPSQFEAKSSLAEIVELLRMKTAYDFTQYKPGTLQRRIDRRMSLIGFRPQEMARYLDRLRTDEGELELLAKDFLIHVTSFFRDPKIFDLLTTTIAPELIRDKGPGQPLRIWIVGCSTGEEAYSLAILFLELISVAQRNIKLQVFASDIDSDAIATAREGLYPDSIASEVSPERLSRFFSKEEHGYRVAPELRATVVFTVQNLLTDPPFSRLDLVSCRNLLIYMRPDAQAKIVGLFHFALRQGGILLLGNSEAVVDDGRFETIAKSERIYRHIGHSRPGEFGALSTAIEGMRPPAIRNPALPGARRDDLADLSRSLVLETYAPAAVLINLRHECLYTLGPIDRYLRVTPGHPSRDLLAMARQGMRAKLRAAIQQARVEKTRVVVPGGRIKRNGDTTPYSIAVQPTASGGEDLLLVCFIDEATPERRPGRPAGAEDAPRIAELQQELEATRLELEGAIHNLEASYSEKTTLHEEALSINEEFQSTNEELLTSKEELQSLNEELTALNGQLQETLERQRTTANDLENVLFSTDVATLFLDNDLRIRFFTPATRKLFNVIPSDIGRPLNDLNPMAADDAVLSDARTVLQTQSPVEKEVEDSSGLWYIRRILPYRTQDDAIEGVVITFTDITERKQVARALEAARQEADRANIAKSRFLAAASHDLRQPLQTLALLQALMATKFDAGTTTGKMVALLDQTVGAMTGMLNTLLDINQIDTGAMRVEPRSFMIDSLLNRLGTEFAYHAESHGLTFRVVRSSLSVDSDPRLLEQMLRNLLANAFKHTLNGKILLGCRRRSGSLSIEVWDTGVGIPAAELQSIFEEYRQLDNAARQSHRGMGLGLSIVQRLADLLGHRVSVRSVPGKGSVFAIDVEAKAADPRPRQDAGTRDANITASDRRGGLILIVEDDPEVRQLLRELLEVDGFDAVVAGDGAAALALLERQALQPDLILTDYELPGELDGLQLASKIRELLRRELPLIVLTGDVSTGSMSDNQVPNSTSLTKPATAEELTGTIQRMLSMPQSDPGPAAAGSGEDLPIVYVVDDDSQIRKTMRGVLEEAGWRIEDYGSCEAFLDAYRPDHEACLLVDAYLPGMSGLEVLQKLRDAGDRLPVIVITGSSDVSMAVQAMKSGASDFILKPMSFDELAEGVATAMKLSKDMAELSAMRDDAARRVGSLTPRQRQIMHLVLDGQPSKNIAADLGVSQRTVENHRAAIMEKMGVKSIPALARLAFAAGVDSAGSSSPDSAH